MSVHLHRAGRADRLAADLAELLATPLPDPFATEIVSVPTRGVERWLAQTLSHRLGRTPDDPSGERGDGVCAGVAFWSPRRLTAQVGAGLTESADDGPAAAQPGPDEWLPERLTWPLLNVLTEAETESWAQPVWTYLRRDRGSETATGAATSAAGSRRWATARHLAELLDRYLTTRPTMINRWRAGEDTDEDGQQLPPSLAWQAECFRRLLGRITQPDPVARLEQVTRLLQADPSRFDLPDRLSIFGPTRLPHDQLQMITALGAHRDVHLWLPHPSDTLWQRARSRLADRTAGRGPVRRVDDPTADVPRHRLLAYLGRDVRELQTVLDAAGIRDHGAGDHDRHDNHDHEYDHDHDEQPETLLGRLQSDISADRPLTGLTARPPLDAADESVGVHACHGPDRQVEVLRELLLDLLEDDPRLEPRDIIVMCPDIETFAPLISASFGVESEELDHAHPGHRLRVRLADRSLRQLNPLLAVLGRLFELASARIEASSILDLCASEPVATKFGLREEDILRMRVLVGKSGVRWGLDAADRRRFGMEAFGQNTWQAGLDRLLLGITMDEEGEHYLGTTLPLDDVDAADVDLLGRLAEIVARVGTFLELINESRSLRDWMTLCRDTLDALTSAAPGESWQTAQAYRELSRIATSVDDHAVVDHEREDDDHGEARLSRAEITSVLQEAFRGRPSRANFRTGTLTMCTMMPMRSVPHRVVCLLGLDDGVFPRAGEVDGDDIAARTEMVGDRDRRSEDRQLMLDAIMAAEEKLIIVYSGADPRTNAERPPSVPVGELLDVLDLTAVSATGGPVRAQILHRHPLQPFDPRNFSSPSDPARPFSFDRSALEGARVLERGRRSAGDLPPTQLTTAPVSADIVLPELVELSELVRFFNHPVKAYLRRQAGYAVLEEETDDPEEVPIRLDHLELWQIGERMLDLRLAGVDQGRVVDAEWRRGTLPPRQLGIRALDPVARDVAELARAAEPLLRGERDQHELSVAVTVAGREHQVVGSLSDVVDRRIVRASYSRLSAKHRLRAWIELLALSATEPTVPWQAMIIGRGARTVLGPVPPDTAQLLLADLVDLYRTGLSGPLPLPVKLSAEYARLRDLDRSEHVFRRRLIDLWAKEIDAVFRLFFRGEDEAGDYAALEADPRVPGEERGGFGEPTRFGTLARRVWQPLLGLEDLR